jgi:hypothetical protein
VATIRGAEQKVFIEQLLGGESILGQIVAIRVPSTPLVARIS